MQYFRTIRTRDTEATPTRGPRILATLAGNQRRLAVPYDGSLTSQQNHETAARALYAAAYGWPGQPVPKPAGYSEADNSTLWHFTAVQGQP